MLRIRIDRKYQDNFFFIPQSTCSSLPTDAVVSVSSHAIHGPFPSFSLKNPFSQMVQAELALSCPYPATQTEKVKDFRLVNLRGFITFPSLCHCGIKRTYYM